jgi:hypothetical protein
MVPLRRASVAEEAVPLTRGGSGCFANRALVERTHFCPILPLERPGDVLGVFIHFLRCLFSGDKITLRKLVETFGFGGDSWEVFLVLAVASLQI